jgi:hypothetical protein
VPALATRWPAAFLISAMPAEAGAAVASASAAQVSVRRITI